MKIKNMSGFQMSKMVKIKKHCHKNLTRDTVGKIAYMSKLSNMTRDQKCNYYYYYFRFLPERRNA